MRIDKYLICGGEDLGVLIKSNQSPEALVTFKKWRPFLSKSCNETGKDCLFFTPLPNGSYFLMKTVVENRSGARTLMWSIGIELTKSDFLSVGNYYLVSKGFINITINQIKEAYDSSGKPFDVNFRFPQNTFIEEYCFEDIKGKDFKGQYPQILDEFTGKLSNSSLEALLEKLCIAVNPHEYCEEFTCMVGNRIPLRTIKNREEFVADADIIPEKQNVSKIRETSADKTEEVHKILKGALSYLGSNKLLVVFILLVFSGSLNVILIKKITLLSKNVEELNAANIQLRQNINTSNMSEVKDERKKHNTEKPTSTISDKLHEVWKSICNFFRR